MVRGEADRAGIRIEIVEPDRVRLVDDRAEESVAARQLADLGRILRREPDMDELLQPPVGADDTERAVAGIHQIEPGLDDASEHLREFEPLDHEAVRRDQAAKTPLGGEHPLRLFDELADRELQLGARAIGEDDRLGTGHDAPLHSGVTSVVAALSADSVTFTPPISSASARRRGDPPRRSSAPAPRRTGDR